MIRSFLSGTSHGQTLFWLGRTLLPVVRDLVHRHAAEIATAGIVHRTRNRRSVMLAAGALDIVAERRHVSQMPKPPLPIA